MINWNNSRYLRDNCTSEEVRAIQVTEKCQFITQQRSYEVPAYDWIVRDSSNHYHVYSDEYIISNYKFL